MTLNFDLIAKYGCVVHRCLTEGPVGPIPPCTALTKPCAPPQGPSATQEKALFPHQLRSAKLPKANITPES